jgi:hypothetical protein
MTADEQANWRIEFEKTGEAQVRQNLSNPAIYNSPAKSDFARQWLREREGARAARAADTFLHAADVVDRCCCGGRRRHLL